MTLKPKTPLGCLPVLKNEETGFELSESIAVARYCAKKAGLYPTNEEEASLSDMYVDNMNDKRNQFVVAVVKKDTETIDKFLSTILPEYLTFLESKINENGFLVGKSMSWADICLLDSVQLAQYEVTDAHPKIKKLLETVKSCEGLKDYLSSERKSVTWSFK
jgi:glutathione S-transferase